MTTERNDRRSRAIVQWGYPELKNVSKVSSHTEDHAYTQTLTTPDEQGFIFNMCFFLIQSKRSRAAIRASA